MAECESKARLLANSTFAQPVLEAVAGCTSVIAVKADVHEVVTQLSSNMCLWDMIIINEKFLVCLVSDSRSESGGVGVLLV